MQNLQYVAIMVLGQAAQDYETAYQKKDLKTLRELEDWFTGEGFDSLNLSADGSKILDMLQERLENNGGKLR